VCPGRRRVARGVGPLAPAGTAAVAFGDSCTVPRPLPRNASSRPHPHRRAKCELNNNPPSLTIPFRYDLKLILFGDVWPAGYFEVKLQNPLHLVVLCDKRMHPSTGTSF